MSWWPTYRVRFHQLSQWGAPEPMRFKDWPPPQIPPTFKFLPRSVSSDLPGHSPSIFRLWQNILAAEFLDQPWALLPTPCPWFLCARSLVAGGVGSALWLGGLSYYLQLFSSLDTLYFQVMLRLWFQQSFNPHSCYSDLFGEETPRNGDPGSCCGPQLPRIPPPFVLWLFKTEFCSLAFTLSYVPIFAFEVITSSLRIISCVAQLWYVIFSLWLQSKTTQIYYLFSNFCCVRVFFP